MKSTDYMLKYFGEGDLSAFNKIISTYEKEVNKAINKEIKEILRQKTLRGEVMDNEVLEVVYILDNTEGNIELRVFADNIEQRNGWVFALWNNQIVGGVKEESLKAFYLTHNTSI